MRSQSLTARHHLLSDAAPQSAAHAVARAPRALREKVETMSPEAVLAEYAAPPGPVRLGHWECIDAGRPVSRMGPRPLRYQATLAVGDTTSTSTATAIGPVAALTEMLHERGVAVETVSFHQVPAGQCTATFLHGTNGVRAEWAMGWAEDPTRSALGAVIACANRLLS
ncbi:hypothetical protein [Mycolicibacterium thermoresistibile]|jgi:hypothetical protein|uniref:hypothetical protein n=1 Tax=Mycolicibacterium thermoresistibile TaxID=1797 RepID=UPI00058E19AF|nr:homocitrate synthase [Mycolicibacterium thermoresistibile]